MNTARRTNILGRLWRDDGGQSIVFGAITMLFVVIAVVMVFQAGMLVDKRIQAQNAADAAAYSGACAKAMCVNSIEWLNAGMGYIYRRMLDYEYDSMYFSGTTFTGETMDWGNFSAAYAQSSEWIERGTRWMQRVAQMEEGIANAAPRLIQEEVYRIARENGAQAAAVWPDAPEHEMFVRRDDHLNCVFQPIGPAGWFISSNGDYVLRTQRTGPFYFDFSIHDNEFAHNGVNTRGAVAVKIRGASGPRNLRITGNFIYFYDGSSYAASLSRTTLPGNPPVDVLVLTFGDGSEEIIDLQALQRSGQTSVTHQYRYVTVTWAINWVNGNVRADLYRVAVVYGNTYVESYPGYMYVRGGFSNGALSASYEVYANQVVVSGPGKTSSLGGMWLYEDFGGIGLSGADPAFVEDSVPRFLRRGVSAPHGSIDPAFGRTRQSDDFFVFVRRGIVAQRVAQAVSWQVYGQAPDYQAIDLARIPLGLSISEEFLRYGVNVGVWMPRESTIPFFTNPEHGFFAVASAQLGKRATVNGLNLTPPDDRLVVMVEPAGLIYNYSMAPYSYVRVFDDETARWSAVAAQQPQGYWYAVLTPIKTAMLTEDLNGAGGGYSTSAEMVFDKLLSSEWRDTTTGAVNIQIPILLRRIEKPEYYLEQETEDYIPQEGRSAPFEYSGGEFDDSLQH